jgi:hypothetical protein
MEQGATAFNLKRGPGGVVDIEFLVQLLQLVHGLDDASLQTTETLAGLVALHERGILMTSSFVFLSAAPRRAKRSPYCLVQLSPLYCRQELSHDLDKVFA